MTLEIRVSGEEPELHTALEVLARTFTVVKQTGPYRNHRQPGSRRYLEITIPTSRGTNPAVLPELPHTHVLRLHGAGKSIAQIVAETGLAELDVQAALDNAAYGTPSARAAKTAGMRRRAAAKTETTTRTATAPVLDTTGDVLDWGSHHDNLRVRAAARRAREDLAELRRRRAAEAEARTAAIDLEIRMAELATAKARARAAGDAVTNPNPRSPEDYP